MMTTRNSTSAQLTGQRISKKVKQFAIGINILSALMIILFVVISKL